MVVSFIAIFLLLVFLSLLIWDIYERFQIFYKACSKCSRKKIRYPIIGNLTEMIYLTPENCFDYLNMKMKLYKNKCYALWMPGIFVINIMRAKDAEVVLSSTKHIQKSWVYSFLHPFLMTGLLTSNGKKWFQRRKILTPAFHFNILQQFYTTFKEQSDHFISDIKRESIVSDGVDIHNMLSRFTLNIISETAMGYKQTSIESSDAYRKKLYILGEIIVNRLLRPWLLSDIIWKVLGYHNKLVQLLASTHEYTANFIDKRRQEFITNPEKFQDLNENVYETKKTRYAMLDTLLAAESEGKIDRQGIQEEVDTFTFEGHDTISTAIMFTVFLLAQHPEVQEKIFDEIKAIHGDDIDHITASELSSLNNLDRAIKESLRLYPSVMFISRELTESDVIDGVECPKNTVIIIHIYHLHRDPEYYPDPEKFDPDRFLPENVNKRHPYAYIPFSAGPRNCVGQKFAYLEMKTILTKMIWNFKILPVTKIEDVHLVGDMVIRTKDPIKVKFIRR